jgi:L-2-hydroxyglutarate oxidase LhgO
MGRWSSIASGSSPDALRGTREGRDLKPSIGRIECVVVGAGVIGLAVARALARRGREVIVLESAGVIGSETSSRNSGVIHAGIYYPPDSLKARLCVAGKEALYGFCEAHGVAHARVGKILVATDEAQHAVLEDYRRRAAANGVRDLEPLTPGQVRALEPEVRCSAALLSPSTGIVDAHEYMLALRGDAEEAGAMVALRSPLVGAEVGEGGFSLEVAGSEPGTLACERLVNAAGLNAQAVAAGIRGFPPHLVPPIFYAKGNYFHLTGRCRFRHLVYPMPTQGSLGVHVSFDVAGRCRFGPDIHWVDRVDYRVDETERAAFYRAIRRYWPAMPDDSLEPDYSGVRPKLTPAGAPAADFVIQSDATHGVPGLVNLFGIESPGLTSSLAIADCVADALQPR